MRMTEVLPFLVFAGYGRQVLSSWQSDSLSPFHHAFPVHDLSLAKHFYGEVLGLPEGRSSSRWQDYSLEGNQIVCHLVGPDYRCPDFYNPVDGDEVPVPHFGLAMSAGNFHRFAKRLREHKVPFIIEPHLRFQGQPGEQWTMFFKDPSGNNLEFKAMTNPENLFAKYHVDDTKAETTATSVHSQGQGQGQGQGQVDGSVPESLGRAEIEDGEL
ncbi:unnamed protein product [Discosporangium mesarthrocarpum]